MFKSLICIIFLLLSISATSTNASTDPLPSWNNTATKQKIINFVQHVTDKKDKDYTPPAERIVTMDNDGTLWLEQPMYPQVLFAMDRIKILAKKHPEWKNIQPFKAILANDKIALANLSGHDIDKLFAAAQSGMSVEEYIKISTDWLATAKNPRFNRKYTELVYQPMLELMNYLRDHQFILYIVTGGSQEFVRVFAPQIYNIPIERVIGTAGKVEYRYQQQQPVLIKSPQVLFFDDKAGKPESIHLFIGRHPLMAFGNSIGDQQMLEWTQARKGAHFMLLIHHDDAKREYDYGSHSKIGPFTDALMQEANKNGWVVVSMKNDWKTIFP